MESLMYLECSESLGMTNMTLNNTFLCSYHTYIIYIKYSYNIYVYVLYMYICVSVMDGYGYILRERKIFQNRFYIEIC